MMSRCLFVCLMAVVVMYAEGAQFIQNPVEKPIPLRDQVGCYSTVTKTVIPFDIASQIPNECSIQTCYRDGTIIGASCGVISVNDPDCRVSGKVYSLPYPDCCPKIICNSL